MGYEGYKDERVMCGVCKKYVSDKEVLTGKAWDDMKFPNTRYHLKCKPRKQEEAHRER